MCGSDREGEKKGGLSTQNDRREKEKKKRNVRNQLQNVCTAVLTCVHPRERRVRCCSPPVVRVFPDAKPRIRNESETMKKKNDTSKKRYSKQGKELNPPPANSSLQPRRGGTPIHSLVRVCACACVYIGTRQPWQQHVRRVLCSTEASMCAPGTSTTASNTESKKKKKQFCSLWSWSRQSAEEKCVTITCRTVQGTFLKQLSPSLL